MATYSSEDLAAISTYGEVFFTPKEIAIILQLNMQDFIDDCRDINHEAHAAYMKGTLLSEAKIRKSIINLAISGSTPAQNLSLDILKAL